MTLRWGRPPEGTNGSPVPYSGLENPMDRGACREAVHGSQRGRVWWGRVTSLPEIPECSPFVCQQRPEFLPAVSRLPCRGLDVPSGGRYTFMPQHRPGRASSWPPGGRGPVMEPVFPIIAVFPEFCDDPGLYLSASLSYELTGISPHCLPQNSHLKVVLMPIFTELDCIW